MVVLFPSLVGGD
uniref:Uncharacterized protein n=1 Tax=Arundo donax TaxID=35708 RepID=A0A0A9FUB4_ARUDO